MLAIPVAAGHGIDVREHVFLVATRSVTYDYLVSPVWYETREGNETERHWPLGLLLDRFSADSEPGLVLIHAHGNAFVRTLAPGESVMVKGSALLYKDPSVDMRLHFELAERKGFASWFSSMWNYQRYVWIHLTGPGRVAIQSAYGHHHDPERAIYRSSHATEQRW